MRIFITSLLITVILTLALSPIAMAWDITVLQQYNHTGDNEKYNIFAQIAVAQTFTPDVSYELDYLKLKLYKDGTPELLIVEVQTVNTSGAPSGNVISEGFINGTDLNATLSKYEKIPMSNYHLSAGVQYAIVVTSTNPDSLNSVWWKRHDGGSVFAGGKMYFSPDNGDTWQTKVTKDAMFEIWGRNSTQINDVEVYSGFLEPDDWLIVAQVQTTYAPYYPLANPKDYFRSQFINRHPLEYQIFGQVPLPQWDRKPVSIYFSASESASMEWGDPANEFYYYHLNSTFTPYVFAEYRLTATD